MKRQFMFSIVLGFLFVAGLVVFATSYFSGRYLSAHSNAQSAAAKCPGKHPVHIVTIYNDKVMPELSQASLCDSLTIINKDNRQREIGFGEHAHHQAYDGVSERLLGKGQSLGVILNRAGTYKFHDHFQDEVTGYFTVTD